MKKLKNCILASFVILTSGLISSCSNEDEPKKEVPVKEEIKLNNTKWKSTEGNEHDLQSFFVDKQDRNETVLAIVQQISGLNRTYEEKSETIDVSVNLCEKSGHAEDAEMTFSFAKDNCKIDVKTWQSRYTAKRTTIEKMYKFEEGTFVVNTGGSNYMGVNVYNYGIYWATGAILLPLDGNGCVTYETEITYKDKKVEIENEKSISIDSDYSVSGNQVSFTYFDNQLNVTKTFTGNININEEESILTIKNNPLVENISELIRQN